MFGYSGAGFIERQLIGYEDEMTRGCIGSLSEMYDGNPPYQGRGAVSTAKNVGQILEALRLVRQQMKEYDERLRQETKQSGITAGEEVKK